MPSFQVFVLGSTVGFLSPFPDSLPQLVLRCLPCAFAFGLSPFIRLSFVYLFSGSGYSAFVSSFPLSSCLCLTTAFPVLPFCFRFFGLPRSFRPGLPCLIPRFFVLGFSVSFLSLFPDSLPQLFLRCLPYACAFGLFPFRSASFRPLLFRFLLLSFPSLPFVSLPCLTSWLVSQVLPLCLSTSLLFPLPFRLVSRASLSFLTTWLSVCFLSSLPVSLPQLFHRCSHSSRFRAFP